MIDNIKRTKKGFNQLFPRCKNLTYAISKLLRNQEGIEGITRHTKRRDKEHLQW
jgi:hypothetical protein